MKTRIKGNGERKITEKREVAEKDKEEGKYKEKRKWNKQKGEGGGRMSQNMPRFS
jgi:hypothetical protein